MYFQFILRQSRIHDNVLKALIYKGKSDMMSSYLFSEISNFNLDQLIAVRGWLGGKPQKVYRDEQSQQHYLHDETTGRLFAFQIDPAKLKENNEYENIVASYLARRDGQ